MSDTPKVLILKNYLSPGDILCMTAAVHSLHKAHPGQFLTAVDTGAPAFWEHNPDVIPIDRAQLLGGEVVQMHYPLIDVSNQRLVHVLDGYCDFLQVNLRMPVPNLTNRPLLYLSGEEKGWLNQVEETTGGKYRFWLVNAGRKGDFTAKFWGAQNYQRVIDLLRGRVTFVQVGSLEHHHPPLEGTIDLRGKTDLRQLVRLCWHAQGGLGGVTLLMHLMAAWEKPYVCVAGGREPVAWNSYPKQSLVHTVGALPCTREGGCWKSRVVKMGDGSEQDGSLCEQPVLTAAEPIPRCMELIRPEYVAETVLRYAGA